MYTNIYIYIHGYAYGWVNWRYTYMIGSMWGSILIENIWIGNGVLGMSLCTKIIFSFIFWPSGLSQWWCYTYWGRGIVAINWTRIFDEYSNRCNKLNQNMPCIPTWQWWKSFLPEKSVSFPDGFPRFDPLLRAELRWLVTLNSMKVRASWILLRQPTIQKTMERSTTFNG